MNPIKKGIMFVLSSPSGAGKTTLTKLLAKNNSNFVISISHTTRKPRSNEINGLDYYFVKKVNFNKYVKEKKFFEYAKIFGNCYGTLKFPVLKNINSGNDVFFDIDWQGTQQLKKKKGKIKMVSIFVLPPDKKTLKLRLINRTQDGKKLAKKRMRKFDEELSHLVEYDYTVINNNLNDCYKKILSIIKSEKKGKRHKFDLKKTMLVIKKLIK